MEKTALFHLGQHFPHIGIVFLSPQDFQMQARCARGFDHKGGWVEAIFHQVVPIMMVERL
jgi:hypothetical protein